MDNAVNVDAKMLNTPVKRYRIVTENGVETVKVQLKGQEDVRDIRLEKVPHMPKQLKNELLEQAAAVNQPVMQMDRYMEM
ncbi:hypothetical protein P4H32_32360 [Bacillus cereus]|nr:hypothetical protein [Bacillus cereus]